MNATHSRAEPGLLIIPGKKNVPFNLIMVPLCSAAIWRISLISFQCTHTPCWVVSFCQLDTNFSPVKKGPQLRNCLHKIGLQAGKPDGLFSIFLSRTKHAVQETVNSFYYKPVLTAVQLSFLSYLKHYNMPLS